MPIAPVQQVASGTGSGTSYTVAASPAAAMTVGDTMFMAIRLGGGRSLSSVTDTQGNSWSVIVATSGGSSNTVGIAYAPITKALTSSDSITATMNTTASGTFGFIVWEYSGVASASPIDSNTAANGTAATFTGSVNTSAYGDMVISAVSAANSVVSSNNFAFVQRGAFVQNLGLFDDLVYAPASIAGSWTATGSYNYGVAMVAVKAANPVGTISFVQRLGGIGQTSSQSIVPVGGQTTAGNRVILHVHTPGVAVSSVVDSQGNTWNLDAQSSSSGARQTFIYSALLTTALGTSDTITVTLASNTGNYVIADEWAGINQSSYLDTTGSAYSNTAATTASASISPSQAGETVIGTVGSSNSGSTWSATGVVARTNQGRVCAVDLQSAPAGAQTSTVTLPSSSTWAYVLAAYKPATGVPHPVTATEPAISASDTARTSVALLRTATETVGVSDQATRTAAMIRAATEPTVASSDTATRSVGRNLTASEPAVPATDTAAATRGFVRTVTESTAVSDTATAGRALLRTAVDTTSVSDTASALRSLLRTASDTTTVSDAATVLFTPGAQPPRPGFPMTASVSSLRATSTVPGRVTTAAIAAVTSQAVVPQRATTATLSA